LKSPWIELKLGKCRRQWVRDSQHEVPEVEKQIIEQTGRVLVYLLSSKRYRKVDIRRSYRICILESGGECLTLSLSMFCRRNLKIMLNALCWKFETSKVGFNLEEKGTSPTPHFRKMVASH